MYTANMKQVFVFANCEEYNKDNKKTYTMYNLIFGIWMILYSLILKKEGVQSNQKYLYKVTKCKLG